MDPDENTPRGRLHKAVIAFYKETEPDTYIHDWVLLSDKDVKESDGLRAIDKPYKGELAIITSSGTRWSTIVGMLDIALNWKRNH